MLSTRQPKAPPGASSGPGGVKSKEARRRSVGRGQLALCQVGRVDSNRFERATQAYELARAGRSGVGGNLKGAGYWTFADAACGSLAGLETETLYVVVTVVFRRLLPDLSCQMRLRFVPDVSLASSGHIPPAAHSGRKANSTTCDDRGHRLGGPFTGSSAAKTSADRH